MSGPSQYPYYPLSPLKVDYYSAFLGFPLTARSKAAVAERLKVYRERGGAGGRMDSWGDEKEGAGEKIKKAGEKPVEGKDGKKKEEKEGEKKGEKKGEKNGEKKGERKKEEKEEGKREEKKEEKKEEKGSGEKAAFTEEEDGQILEWNGSGKAWKELAKMLQRPESDQFILKARAKELAAKGGAGGGKDKKEEGEKGGGGEDRGKGAEGKKQGKREVESRIGGMSDVDLGDDWVNVDEGDDEKEGKGGREKRSGDKGEEKRKRKRNEKEGEKRDEDETGAGVLEEGDLVLLRRLLSEDDKQEQEKRDRLSRAIRVKSRFFDLVSRDVHEEDVAEALQLG